MKLGEIARVTRGVTTGNRALFVMTRAEAKERGIEQFVRPVIGSVKEWPKTGTPVVHDGPEREVVILATRHDVERHPALKAYLGDVVPRIATAKGPPILATYVGVPRFCANPDGLVVTNSFYTVTPRQPMTANEVAALVERLNDAAIKWMPRDRHYADRRTPRQLESIEL